MPVDRKPLPLDAALVVIDVQAGFDDEGFWGPRNNPECERNIASLIDRWRTTDRPIVFVQHDSANPLSPLHPTNPGHAFKSVIDGQPALLVTKSVNSAFHGAPDLAAWLRGRAISTVVVCGITTNHCCETTARVGSNLGFDVRFAIDATHTFDRADVDGGVLTADELTRVTAANLDGEFGTVMRTDDLLAATTISR